ncbi:MAG: hypothetical protein U1F35_05325 [Steroidobacteraceae bacterium]
MADTGIITDAQIEQERRELAAEQGEDEANDIINQEYYCDFDAAIPGAYYGREISKLEKAGRICDLPHDPRFPVVTGWDLGVGDPTGIWFAQQIRGTVNIIDYYEHSNRRRSLCAGAQGARIHLRLSHPAARCRAPRVGARSVRARGSMCSRA